MFPQSATNDVENFGHRVLARDYRSLTQKWQPGEILTQTGPLSYTVGVGPNMVWWRHVDQLLDAPAGEIPTSSENSTQDSDDTLMTQSCVTVNSDVPVPKTVDSNLQSVTGSETPERSRRPPLRLDL